MVKTGQSAVYNSRIHSMLTMRSRCLRAANSMMVFLILGCPGMAWPGDWDTMEQQLATKIASASGASPAVLEISNRSSLGQADVEAIRSGLIDRLASLGLKSGASPAAISIQVYLSENVQKYVWVSEIRKGSDPPVVVLVETSRALARGTVREMPATILRKSLLWSSDSKILDAMVINGPRMVVLYAGQIEFFRMQGDHWVEDQAFPVGRSRPWPRDLRGKLVLGKDRSLEAHLPGEFCESNAVGTLAFNCREANDPWPIGTEQLALGAFFTPSRNFFTGVLTPGICKQSTVLPFYSAAPIANDRGAAWLFAGVDGRVHRLDGSNDVIEGKLNWGSDIAAIHSSCGSHWQVLAAGAAGGEEDAVRAYEAVGSEPIAVSQPLVLSGDVTALWTASDNDGAVAVAHNAETGKYEAYLL